jgi:hypothetical protein
MASSESSAAWPWFAAATNALYEIDKAAQAVVDRVSDAQAAAGPGPIGAVCFDDEGLQPLDVPRQVFMKHQLLRSFLSMLSSAPLPVLSIVMPALYLSGQPCGHLQ